VDFPPLAVISCENQKLDAHRSADLIDKLIDDLREFATVPVLILDVDLLMKLRHSLLLQIIRHPISIPRLREGHRLCSLLPTQSLHDFTQDGRIHCEVRLSSRWPCLTIDQKLGNGVSMDDGDGISKPIGLAKLIRSSRFLLFLIAARLIVYTLLDQGSICPPRWSIVAKPIFDLLFPRFWLLNTSDLA
jgi:hypothetical protein